MKNDKSSKSNKAHVAPLRKVQSRCYTTYNSVATLRKVHTCKKFHEKSCGVQHLRRRPIPAHGASAVFPDLWPQSRPDTRWVRSGARSIRESLPLPGPRASPRRRVARQRAEDRSPRPMRGDPAEQVFMVGFCHEAEREIHPSVAGKSLEPVKLSFSRSQRRDCSTGYNTSILTQVVYK